MGREFLFGLMKYFKIRLMWWFHNSVNVQKPSKLYALNGWILWYVYISVKVLKIIFRIFWSLSCLVPVRKWHLPIITPILTLPFFVLFWLISIYFSLFFSCSLPLHPFLSSSFRIPPKFPQKRISNWLMDGFFKKNP